MVLIEELNKRELTIGELLKGSWEVLKKSIWPIILFYIIASIIIFAWIFVSLFIILSPLSDLIKQNDVQALSQAVATNPITYISLFLSIFLFCFINIGPILIVRDIFEGINIKIFSILKNSFFKIFPFLGFALLTCLFLLGIPLIIGGIAAISKSVVISVIFSLLSLAIFIVLLIYFLPRIFIGFYNVICTDNSVLAVWSYARDICHLNWKHIIGRIMIVWVALWVITFGSNIIISILQSITPDSLSIRLLFYSLSFIVALAVSAYSVVTMFVLYVNIVSVKENTLNMELSSEMQDNNIPLNAQDNKGNIPDVLQNKE